MQNCETGGVFVQVIKQ